MPNGLRSLTVSGRDMAKLPGMVFLIYCQNLLSRANLPLFLEPLLVRKEKVKVF